MLIYYRKDTFSGTKTSNTRKLKDRLIKESNPSKGLEK